jgi:hypothetical protein
MNNHWPGAAERIKKYGFLIDAALVSLFLTVRDIAVRDGNKGTYEVYTGKAKDWPGDWPLMDGAGDWEIVCIDDAFDLKNLPQLDDDVVVTPLKPGEPNS